MLRMPLNEKRKSTVVVECLCNGRIARCPKCNGEGSYERRSCESCGGMGKLSPDAQGKCPACRGQGFNPIDDVTGYNTVQL